MPINKYTKVLDGATIDRYQDDQQLRIAIAISVVLYIGLNILLLRLKPQVVCRSGDLSSWTSYFNAGEIFVFCYIFLSQLISIAGIFRFDINFKSKININLCGCYIALLSFITSIIHFTSNDISCRNHFG